MATIIDRYAELTGGTPTPGPEPWPAAVALIAGIVPPAMAGESSNWQSALYPEGLAALALGTYLIAAEEARPADQVTIARVYADLCGPSPAPGWGPAVSQRHAVPSWTGRLRRLGHDPDGAAGHPGDPLTDLWLRLCADTAPPGETGMDDTSFIRAGTVLINAVEPTLAALHRLGASMDWEPARRPVL